MHFFAFLLGVALLYFLPSFLAINRHHPAWPVIVLLNIFLGWTVIVWCVLIVFAARYPPYR